MYKVKHIAMQLLSLALVLTGCSSMTNTTTETNTQAMQQALAAGKAVVHLEWNYHGKQLYTSWLRVEDLDKKPDQFIGFYFLTGHNKLPVQSQDSREIAHYLSFASKSGSRVAILEPGTYTLARISPQTMTQRLGHDWYIFTYGLSGDVAELRQQIKNNDTLATFTVKAGEELYLPRVELVNDPANYTKDKQFHITIEGNAKAYKIGKKLVVDPLQPADGTASK